MTWGSAIYSLRFAKRWHYSKSLLTSPAQQSGGAGSVRRAPARRAGAGSQPKNRANPRRKAGEGRADCTKNKSKSRQQKMPIIYTPCAPSTLAPVAYPTPSFVPCIHSAFPPSALPRSAMRVSAASLSRLWGWPHSLRAPGNCVARLIGLLLVLHSFRKCSTGQKGLFCKEKASIRSTLGWRFSGIRHFRKKRSVATLLPATLTQNGVRRPLALLPPSLISAFPHCF